MSKILVVEDDSFLISLEVNKLTKAGYEVVSAVNGADGMKKIEEPEIGLVLLDLMLPDIDGFEILKKIREGSATKKVPVIVFSNMSEEKDIKKAEDLGVSKFMVKSNFTLDELIDEVKKVMK